MAVVDFTNNWKNILDKVQSTLRSEFKGAAPVFIGRADESSGTQYFRLEPVGSALIELAAFLTVPLPDNNLDSLVILNVGFVA